MAMKMPVHPGRIVRMECIQASDMTITAAADRLGVTRQTLNNLVNENSCLSPEMSIRLEKVGWGNAEMWLRLQTSYDLAEVRARESEIIVRVANG